jgi:putative hemolysin
MPSQAIRRLVALTPKLRPELSLWPLRTNPASLGRLGDLEVRLAATPFEVRRAQTLRYRIFYEEMSAVADFRTRHTRRDADRFDRFCDHLLVIDHAHRNSRLGRASEIVGTYRVLRQDGADAAGGFYSAGEFDLAPLVRGKPGLSILELGRSCVLPDYRNKRTLELLWHGIWAYVLKHRAEVMIGCASLKGTDPEKLALPLSFLHHHCRAPDEWRIAAHGDRHVRMDLLPVEAIDAKAALRALPPLIKGYLRLGAFVGDGAVIDRQFGTTDVAIVLPIAGIAARYVDYFGADAGRFAVSAERRPEDVALAAA